MSYKIIKFKVLKDDILSYKSSPDSRPDFLSFSSKCKDLEPRKVGSTIELKIIMRSRCGD